VNHLQHVRLRYGLYFRSTNRRRLERLRDCSPCQENRRSEMSDLFEKGLAIRKAVLGKEYVEKSLAGADDFTRPMQQFVTQYCWGEIWGNTTLSRRDRSLVNI